MIKTNTKYFTMKTMNRRSFVFTSVGAAAVTLPLTHQITAANADSKINVAFMGLGGRGRDLLDKFLSRDDVEVSWLTDPDNRRLAVAEAAVRKARSAIVKSSQDFRNMLADPKVQVVVNATPDHWHALGTILACQAGKDVYVEKPMAHNVWEGRKMIEAARKHKRVVQVGMQTRSAAYALGAKKLIQAGKLGDIRMVRVYNMMLHQREMKAADQSPPSSLDYDMWCGPAAKLPYNPGRYWLNHYEYSCGPIAGDAVHQLDLARFVMGDPPSPKTVSCLEGIQMLNDGRDTPDTQLAVFEYGDFNLLFQAALWTPYMKKVPMNMRDRDEFPNWHLEGTKIEVLGTKAYLYLGRHGGGWQVIDENQKVVDQCYGRQGDREHIENFLQCVRSRRPANADVEVGHQSNMLCQLANIAGRFGQRKLSFDGQAEQFPSEAAANPYLKRQVYRQPWGIP